MLWTPLQWNEYIIIISPPYQITHTPTQKHFHKQGYSKQTSSDVWLERGGHLVKFWSCCRQALVKYCVCGAWSVHTHTQSLMGMPAPTQRCLFTFHMHRIAKKLFRTTHLQISIEVILQQLQWHFCWKATRCLKGGVPNSNSGYATFPTTLLHCLFSLENHNQRAKSNKIRFIPRQLHNHNIRNIKEVGYIFHLHVIKTFTIWCVNQDIKDMMDLSGSSWWCVHRDVHGMMWLELN